VAVYRFRGLAEAIADICGPPSPGHKQRHLQRDAVLQRWRAAAASVFLWLYNIPWWLLVERLRPHPPFKKTEGYFGELYDALHLKAVRHSILYRGALTWNYLLGATAVTLGMIATMWPSREKPLLIADLVVIAVVLTNYLVARLCRLHERFIESRMLAEQFRVARLLCDVGLEQPTNSVVLRRYMLSSEANWMRWLFRTAVRQAPLRTERYGRDRLGKSWERVRSRINKQLKYHKRHRDMAARAERAIGHTGLILFCLALGGGVLAIFVHQATVALITSLTGVIFPAWAAAFVAISLQAELSHMRQQSTHMVTTLKDLQAVCTETDRRLHTGETSRDLGMFSKIVIESCSQIAEMQLEESVDWWTVARPLHFSF
jgi:hypothetical protein